MRVTLDHLPQSKQRELAHIVRVLFEEFEAMHARGNQKWAKQGRILKIVLYGSYARGDWVDDPVGGYKSDYDILVVVSDDRLTEFEFWSARRGSSDAGCDHHQRFDGAGQFHRALPQRCERSA